jgi:hypothetical protein
METPATKGRGCRIPRSEDGTIGSPRHRHEINARQETGVPAQATKIPGQNPGFSGDRSIAFKINE